MGVLGKRKQRHQQYTTTASDDNDRDDYLTIFRRAFETKFAPLKDSETSRYETEAKEINESSRADASDWEGFDSDEDTDEDSKADDQAVEIIEHESDRPTESISKAEARAFMHSKPPSVDSIQIQPSKSLKNAEQDVEENEQLNLKNDLALQRLINESHILDRNRTDKGEPSGGHRQKLIDKRLQALGSKTSILEQQKMPLAHRKGIMEKADERESKRRREARENGVILEKAAKPRKSTGDKMRVRGIGAPGVGKFKGGTLQLSKRDVAEIKASGSRSKMSKHKRKK